MLHNKMRQQFKGITPVYDRLLRGWEDMPVGMYHLHIATADQLCRLQGYSPKSVKLIKTRLHDLADHGYVQMDSVPIQFKLGEVATKFFRSQYYYVLHMEGARYLKLLGYDIKDSFRASEQIGKQPIFIQHRLELNDVVISALLLKQVNPLFYLADYIDERRLRKRLYDVSWRGQRLALVPDAFLDFRAVMPDGRQRRLPVLLEYDCATEFGEGFRSKIRAYGAMLASGTHEQWFGIKSVRIAFTIFKGEKRREQMRAAVREELADEPSLWRSFVFTASPQPPDPLQLWTGRCWYMSQDGQPIALLKGEYK